MLYMNQLLLYKAKSGDYVNARIVILSIIFYAFFFIKIITDKDNSITDITKKASNDSKTKINIVIDNIKAYIEQNNKIQIDSNDATNDELKRIITELHQMSNNVVNTNKDIVIVKKEIENNQLAMRNMLFNIQVRRNSYDKAYREFVISLCILIIVVILCILLLLFNMSSYVYIVCGVVSISVILYIMTLTIMNFMKSVK